MTLIVLALVVTVVLSGCSSRSQIRSDLVKSLEDADSDLQKVQFVLDQTTADRTLPTTAKVGLKYAAQDVVKAQKKASSLKPSDAVSGRDQRRVVVVLSTAVNAVLQAQQAQQRALPMGDAERVVPRSMRSIDRELKRLGATP